MEGVLQEKGYSVDGVRLPLRPGARVPRRALPPGKAGGRAHHMPIGAGGTHLEPALEKGLPVLLLDRPLPHSQAG